MKGKLNARRVITNQEEEDFDLDALVMNASHITSGNKFVRNQKDTELVKVLKSDGSGFVDRGDGFAPSIASVSQGESTDSSGVHSDGTKRSNNSNRSGATFSMLEMKKMFIRTDLQPEAGVAVTASSSGACCDDYHTYLYHGRRYILPSAVQAKEPKHYNGGVGMVSKCV